MGQSTDAVHVIDQLPDNYPYCTCLGDAWLTRAQPAFAKGSPEEGRRIYRTLARLYPAASLAPQALWLSALSSLEAEAHPASVGRDPFDGAVADLLMLASAFPGSNRAPDGLAHAGIGVFERGRYLRRILTHYYHYTRLYPR